MLRQRFSYVLTVSSLSKGEIIFDQQHAPLLFGDGPGEITDEEALSFGTPDYLRCDSCVAVAHELAAAFNAFQSRFKSRLLTETEVVDIVGWLDILW